MSCLHGKWSQAGVPHRGWICQGVEDNGPGSDFVCEMCETQEIRFVHAMAHPEYAGGQPLQCGCICAGHMEGDYVAAREREGQARLRAARRERWPYRMGWRRSAKGNAYLRHEGLLIVTYPLFGRRDQFGFLIRDQVRDRELLRSRKPLPSEHDARQRTFDAVQWVRDRQAKPP